MTDPHVSRPGEGFDFNRPTIIALLYLASFLTGVTAIVGVILAYVWRGEGGDPWASSHYTYLIRTFWMGLIGSIVGGILTIVLIGIPMLIAVAIWLLVRTVMSLINAQKQAPMPDPQTLLF